MNKVYIVGAGCGDINLYTLKAINLIKQADCIVYDDLVDHPVLDYCKEEVNKIYVGKRMHKHSFKQDEINQILIDASLKYPITVRLKGGDPYVFGRGGEEALALQKENIAFEVVPGISSCIGGLEMAGIPVTHRNISRGFQVYTSHFENDKEEPIDFSNMKSDQYTYIFMMSISKLEMIVEGLLSIGKDKKTPIAVVSHASLPSQQVLVSTLEKIIEDYHHNPLPTPGMIVVGNTVKLQESLDFMKQKPLLNKKILVSLTQKDPSFVSALEFYGADVTQIHTGTIEYKAFSIPELKGYFIFTSQHGVKGFMQQFLLQHDLRELYNVKFIVVGKKTKEVLESYGIKADYMPSVYNGASLNKEFKELVKDEGILFRGNHDSTITIASKEIEVYANTPTDIRQLNEYYDYGLFTSPSSFERFYKVNGDMIDIYISIGMHTTSMIKKYIKDKNIITAPVSTKEAMVQVLLEKL